MRQLPRSTRFLLLLPALLGAPSAWAQATNLCNWGDDVTETSAGPGSWGSGCSWSCRKYIVSPPKDCGPAGAGSNTAISYGPSGYTVTVAANAGAYTLDVGNGTTNPAVTLSILPGVTLAVTIDGNIWPNSSLLNAGTLDFGNLPPNQQTPVFTCQTNAVWTNSGTIRKTSAAPLAHIQNCRSATSTGTIRSESGELRLSGGNLFNRSWTISGPVQATTAGASVRLDTTTLLAPGFSFTGPGRLVFGEPNSEITVNHDVSIPNLDLGPSNLPLCGSGCTGILAGTGNVTLTGTSTWNVSAQRGTGQTIVGQGTVVTVQGAMHGSQARSLVNNGTINIFGNGSMLYDDGSITNTGTIDLMVDGPVISGFGSVTNSGTISKSAGTGTTSMGFGQNQALYQNSGTIRVGAGRMYFTRFPEAVRQTAGVMEVGSGRTLACDIFASGFFNLLGGSLTGDGTVDCSVTNGTGATVSPGLSAGQAGRLTVTQNYTQTGTLGLEIGGLTAGTTYDQLVVQKAVTLGGGLQVSTFGGFVPQPNDVFTLLDKTSSGVAAGTFAGLPEGKVFGSGGKTWKVSYVGGNGNDVTATFQFDGVHGDLDKSGTIDVFDVVTMASHIVGNLSGGVPPFTAPAAAADVNLSGSVDVFDVVLLAAYIVGNVASLPQ